ncbi:hypothetical protein SLEP1_g30008 [Rubroshorea leprosula]|uniref:Uncharacterized protein n=1 Tax=Rubroshorea leprosula TaxID=152421 RepID=A0AAV5JYQ5_9ROSI|nr:hypothetical protein SLEP1_g30008 [Rubroshorea leprosula]
MVVSKERTYSCQSSTNQTLSAKSTAGAFTTKPNPGIVIRLQQHYRNNTFCCQ